MTFLQPLLLLGLLGAAVPLLVHLFGRPRARLLRFPTVELLERALAEPAPRRRLRERLLLAARIAAAVALALVLARPATWAVGAPGGGARRVAVVLDDSFSMRLRDGRRVLFDEAKEVVRTTIETAIGAGGEAALLLGGRGSVDPSSEMTADRARLNLALDGLLPSARATDLVSAVARARAALAGAGRVVVVTDGTAPVPAGDDIERVDVGKDTSFRNTALVRVEVDAAGDDPAGALQLTAEVANFSDRAREGTLTLRAGDRTLSRTSVALGPHARLIQRLSASLPAGARAASLALPGDELAIDDTRHFAAEGAREIRVLLVNGDPRPTRGQDELFYLRTALEAAGDPPVRAQAAAPEDVAARLGEQDVVVLCNVRALPEADTFALRAFVRGGGGLLLAAGSNVDPAAPVPLADILPGEPVAVWSAGPEGPREDPATFLRLGPADVAHPALASFAADPDSLRSARFWARLLVRPVAAQDRRTLLRFEDGVPALLERDVGRGRTMQFASTFDRDWNDLVIRPAFAPLVRQLVRHLARHRAAKVADVLVGDPCPLPDGARGEVRVLRPDGREDRSSAAYATTDVPGVYRILATDGTEVSCAVNVDPRESDLRRIPRSVSKKPASGESRRHAVPISHAFAAALLGLLLAESLLARRR